MRGDWRERERGEKMRIQRENGMKIKQIEKRKKLSILSNRKIEKLKINKNKYKKKTYSWGSAGKGYDEK